MHLDVVDLRSFYYRSTLGRAAQKIVRNHLREMWPETKGQSVVGFGFAVPLLRPFLGEARRVVGLMPGPQGVMAWPDGADNISVLCQEMLWPIETGTVDRLVVMHGLETSDYPAALLEECWRVLGPGGRAVFVVPNRAGLWSRRDQTPLGYGRPYSLGQLETQLRKHRFVTEHTLSTLYQPPSHRKFWRKTAAFWERMGSSLPWITAGGVLMVEVSKQVAAKPRSGLTEKVRKPLRVLEGIATPEPARGRASPRTQRLEP